MDLVCPCSGAGGAEVVWPAVVFSAVLLVARPRRCRKHNVIRRSDVKNEEHESKSFFGGRAAVPSQENEDSGKARHFPWKAAVVIGLTILVGLVFALETGSTTCIPCKMMKPILDELRQ